MIRIYLFIFLLALPALAQNSGDRVEPAATGPAYDLSVGYTYLSTSSPAGNIHLNGVDGSGTIDVAPRWGGTLNGSFVRTGDVLGTGHGGYVLSVLGGPVFYPAERGKTRFFVHALAGVAVVDSAVPLSSTSYLAGWLGRFSYDFGGGVEQYIAGPFGVRAGADFQRTEFANALDVIRPENNLRLTLSVIFRPRRGQRYSTKY